MARSIEPLLDFFLREKGEPVQINNMQQLALIRDADNNIQSTDEKMIRTATWLQTGDFIDYRNDRYLITSEIDRNEHSYRGRMRKCNFKIAFNFQGNVKWFDAIVEGKTFSIHDGKVISIPEGNINVYLQDSTDTRDIVLSQRFYNTHQPFKVVGIDRTVKGIIQLNCTLDLKLTDDDVDNNIAERWKYEIAHNYELTIDNGTAANVLTHDTFQLKCTVTDNGSPLPHAPITFTSSDPNVISVDHQGMVTGLQIGQATITAKLTYQPTVQATIQITAVETLTHNYSISITGNSTIRIGQSISYACHIYDKSNEVFDQPVQWSVRNQDDSTPIMATIAASTENSITIRAGTPSSYTNKYIVLSAALSSDSTVTIEKTVQLKSLF